MIEVEEANGLNSRGLKGHRWLDITNKPMPTILQSRLVKIRIIPPYKDEEVMIEKPPYKVPLMADIEAIPWNGFNVVSTFSGCGGSCLGFRMVGFRILWASEFIPAAQEVYRLNHPNSILDTRDIRQVQPQEILEAIGLERGEIDILEGSPPCASFSIAGKIEKGWGKTRKYSDTEQRVDDLFFEYARILEGLQPKVFIAENVSGLVKGKAKGYFKLILQRLKDCGYDVRAKVLDAQWLGVPQRRQRLIFIGVREDLGIRPVFPKPLSYWYSVREAIPWIIELRRGMGFGNEMWIDAEQAVSQTIGTQPSSGNNFNNRACKIKAVEPESDISRFAIGREWDKLAQGEQSGKYFNLIKARIDKPCPTVTQRGEHPSTASVTHPIEKRKFSIAELKRICAFPDDFQLTGTYSQQWERLGRAVPPVMMAAIAKVIRDEILCKLK